METVVIGAPVVLALAFVSMYWWNQYSKQRDWKQAERRAREILNYDKDDHA